MSLGDLAVQVGGSIARSNVLNSVDEYEKYHTSYGGDEEKRKSNYTDMVNKYYDLATSFYEYGWGESFHFAHRLNGESLKESIKRHEHFLALNLGLKPDMKVLDVGCGIGGPLREIAAFSGAQITGLNNNSYQISRGEVLNKKVGLDKICNFMKADFMNIPAADNTYDAVYAIEATCHAPDAVGCYAEILRVLKPGQQFAAYEWALTDKYDPENAVHKDCKSKIEIGNGLPDIRTEAQIVESLKAAGFEVLRSEDLDKTSQVSWYEPLDTSRWSLSSFRLTKVGRFLTRNLVRGLETLKLAPEGSVRVSNFLETAADGLVDGARQGIFTPLLFLLARKPLQ
ncbi:hypothetical protein R1flu_005990 [Riccia fluitans]|uniref:Methyltransferase n=1 Tax=Riccia fluitans TaxID=41844 RepID=A0ABD1YUQ9_9MARC